MLDFRIHTFLAVCKTMNFTKAAQELNITQPAVSQHMKFLEDEYGTKLFAYNGKSMYLTEAGMFLQSAATTMVHDEIYLYEKMEELKGKTKKLAFGGNPYHWRICYAEGFGRLPCAPP